MCGEYGASEHSSCGGGRGHTLVARSPPGMGERGLGVRTCEELCEAVVRLHVFGCLAVSVEIPSLGASDHAIGEPSHLHGLRSRRLDALVLDQRGDHVLHHCHAMRVATAHPRTELDAAALRQQQRWQRGRPSCGQYRAARGSWPRHHRSQSAHQDGHAHVRAPAATTAPLGSPRRVIKCSVTTAVGGSACGVAVY